MRYYHHHGGEVSFVSINGWHFTYLSNRLKVCGEFRQLELFWGE